MVGASVLFGGSGTVLTDALGQATETVSANTIAGTYVVVATVGGVSQTASFSLSNTADVANSITVTSGSGQSTIVNTAFANALVATVTDQFGNPVPGVSVFFRRAASGPGLRIVGGSGTVLTDAAGQATETVSANTVAGIYAVSATVGGVSQAANFALTNSPDVANSITATSGSGQSTTVNTAFASALVATVTDQFGNPVPGVSVSFPAPVAGASVLFGGSSMVSTDAAGQASVIVSANTVAGSYAVGATVGGVSQAASFALTNAPDVANSITVSSGDIQSATVNTAFANSLVATVTDQFGNPVPGVSVSFAAPASGPSALVGGSGTVLTDAAGQATETVVTPNTIAGTVRRRSDGRRCQPGGQLRSDQRPRRGKLHHGFVRRAGQSRHRQHRLCQCRSVATVLGPVRQSPVPGVSVIFVAPPTGPSALVGGYFGMVFTDAAGQATETVSANTVAGSYAVTATVGGVNTPIAFALTNTPDVANSVTVEFGSGQSALVNTGFQNVLQASVTDQFGNPVPGVTVNFAAPGSGASGTFGDSASVVTDANGLALESVTANTIAGDYQVTASIGTASTAFDLTNVALAADHFSVTGFPLLSDAGQANVFTVRALDPFGNVDTGYEGLVQFSSTDPLAVFPVTSSFLIGGVGQFIVTFRSSGQKTLTATDTVTSSITGSESGIQVNPVVNVTGTVFTQLVNQNFTGAVASFTTSLSTSPREFTASIDWDDGTTTAGTVVANSSGGFDVIGSHTFTTVTTFLVQVTVNDHIKNTVEQTSPTGAIVLSAGENVQLQSFGFVTCDQSPSGILATSSSGAAALLNQPMAPGCDTTLFVATYSGDPNATALGGGSIFYDVRATNVTDQGVLVAEASAPRLGLDPDRVVLKFFDPTRNRYVPVVGAAGVNTLIVDRIDGVITVRFDATSMPMLAQLDGSVFTIALQNIAAEVTATIDPTLAQNLIPVARPPSVGPLIVAAAQTASDTRSTATQTLTLEAIGDQFLGVESVQDSTRTRAGVSADDSSGQTTAVFLVRLLKSGGEAAKDWTRLLGLGDPANLIRLMS